MSARARGRLIASAGLVMQLVGCYRTTNVATLAPLNTAYPVSASPQYVDASGEIVTENDYQVIESFKLTRDIVAPRHEDTVTAIILEPDLDKIVNATRGDAITGMKIAANDYDIGSHGSSAGWKLTGWTLGLTGGMLMGGTLFISSDNSDFDGIRDGLMWAGVATLGAGILSYALGVAVREPTAWRLEVSGNVVKRTP